MPSSGTKGAAAWTEFVLRLALGGYFAWYGGSKVFHSGLDDFTQAVANYRIIGAPWDAVVAYTVPWIEIVAGLCLIFGIWKRGALLVIAGLVAVFAIAVGHAWRSGLDISCGCFGDPNGPPMNYSMKFLEFGAYGLAIFFIWKLGSKGSGHVFGGTKLKLPG